MADPGRITTPYPFDPSMPAYDGPLSGCTCAEICCDCRDLLPFGYPSTTMTYEFCLYQRPPHFFPSGDGVTAQQMVDIFLEAEDFYANYPDVTDNVIVIGSMTTTFNPATCRWESADPGSPIYRSHNIWSDGPYCFWTRPVLLYPTNGFDPIPPGIPGGTITIAVNYTFERAKPSGSDGSSSCTRCQQFWPATQEMSQVATAMDGSGLSISRTLYPLRHKYARFTAPTTVTYPVMTSPSHRAYSWTTLPVRSMNTTGLIADYTSLIAVDNGTTASRLFSPHYAGPTPGSMDHAAAGDSTPGTPQLGHSMINVELQMHQKMLGNGNPRAESVTLLPELTTDPVMTSMQAGSRWTSPTWFANNPGVIASGTPPDWAIPAAGSGRPVYLQNTPGRVITFSPFVYKCWARMAISGQFRPCEIVITPV